MKKNEQEMRSTRDGFGDGLVEAGKDRNVYVLTADLGESTRANKFKEKYPERFVQVGVAEQNLAAVASGLAHAGKIPFITSFSVFSPGRNWEQIRTTICYNDVPVKIASTHSGLGVGEDGATHQALEDIAITRALPNMQVIVPCDYDQAKKATTAIAKTKVPAYLRLGRQNLPAITSEKTEFRIGKAQILKKGEHLTIIACGPMVSEALKAAEELEKRKINAEVINMHTIKPIDVKAITASAKKTKRILTVEDHQVSGGMGSAVAEALSEKLPVKIKMMGTQDAFGESGRPGELYVKHGLTAQAIVKESIAFMKKR